MDSKAFQNGKRDGALYASRMQAIPDMVLNLPPNDYRDGFKAGYVAYKLSGEATQHPDVITGRQMGNSNLFMAWKLKEEFDIRGGLTQRTNHPMGIVLCNNCVVNELILQLVIPALTALPFTQRNKDAIYTWKNIPLYSAGAHKCGFCD